MGRVWSFLARACTWGQKDNVPRSLGDLKLMEQLHRGQERLLGGGLRDELLEGLLGYVGGERASHREAGQGAGGGREPGESPQ